MKFGLRALGFSSFRLNRSGLSIARASELARRQPVEGHGQTANTKIRNSGPEVLISCVLVGPPKEIQPLDFLLPAFLVGPSTGQIRNSAPEFLISLVFGWTTRKGDNSTTTTTTLISQSKSQSGIKAQFIQRQGLRGL